MTKRRLVDKAEVSVTDSVTGRRTLLQRDAPSDEDLRVPVRMDGERQRTTLDCRVEESLRAAAVLGGSERCDGWGDTLDGRRKPLGNTRTSVGGRHTASSDRRG